MEGSLALRLTKVGVVNVHDTSFRWVVRGRVVLLVGDGERWEETVTEERLHPQQDWQAAFHVAE